MGKRNVVTLFLGCSLVLASLTSTLNVHAADPYLGSGMPKCKFSVKFGANYNSNWTTYLNNSIGAWNATSTPVVISTSSSATNVIYAGQYNDSWYGCYIPSKSGSTVTNFTIKVNSRTISNDATNFANFAQSTTVHEFGHSLNLCDNPGTSSSSIMKYSRNRNTMTNPQSFDITNVNNYY